MSKNEARFIIIGSRGPMAYDKNYGGYLYYVRTIPFKNLRPSTKGRQKMQSFTAIEAKHIIKHVVKTRFFEDSVDNYRLIPISL